MYNANQFECCAYLFYSYLKGLGNEMNECELRCFVHVSNSSSWAPISVAIDGDYLIVRYYVLAISRFRTVACACHNNVQIK